MNAISVPINRKRAELQKARLEKSWSRSKFAEVLGCSAEHVKSLEYGRVNPSPQLLFRIANELDKHPESLFPDIVSPTKR